MENTLSSHFINKNNGFTLIELLVVIFVIGVGILSIVILINNNLSLSGKVHNQNTATVLAREGMELLYNYRDTNTLLWYERNCAQRLEEITSETSCKQYFRTWDNAWYYFTIDWAHSELERVALTPISSNNLLEDSKLYLWELGEWYKGYSHKQMPNHTDLWFSRYIVFKEMNNLKDPLISSDIHRVEVHVWYTYGGKTGEVVLSSFIANPY